MHETGSWTHGELLACARQWAAFFRAGGVSAGTRVLAWTPSSNQLSAALLGLWSCGGTYVPIHHGTGLSRVVETAQHLGAGRVLVDAGRAGQLYDAGLTPVLLDGETLSGIPPAALRDPDPDSISHIFHTSGTTGKPKAIAVTHRALSTFLDAWIHALGLGEGEVIYHLYATTFDPWLSGLLPCLMLHGTCIVGDQARPLPRARLEALLDAYAVTSLCTPTAYFHALADLTPPPALRRWVVGGEALAADKAMRFVRADHGTQLINAYGPTETTVWASVLQVTASHAPAVPIGRPMRHCGFRVCDESGAMQPLGVPGELWIGGPQLATGYVGQDELTRTQFVEAEGTRWYRTGDLVRWRLDGDLDFLGRIDRQVQIRGHRVEPAEIEGALRGLPAVADARVEPVDTPHGQTLCAWFIPADASAPPDAVQLKAELLHNLPEYKIPRWLIAVTGFEHGDNGKIDSRRLPRPDADARSGGESRLPSLTLWDLRFIFENTLGLASISIDDNFFDLGGDSLRLVELLDAIERHFGKRLEATTVMQAPTIGQLAPHLEQDRGSAASLVVPLSSGAGPTLYCIPGAGGIGVEFYALARRLQPDHSVIVLRTAGTDGHTHPPETVDALLDAHVAHILSHRTRTAATGPVHLAGYSLGGVFAWEVAQRLRARSVPVGHVVLIDAHAATSAGRKLFENRRRTFIDRLLRRFDAATRARMTGLARRLDDAIRSGHIMEAALLGEYNLLAQATLSMHIDAQPADFRTTYIKAATSNREPHIELWKGLSRQLQIVEVPGDHEGDSAITREPNAIGLADAITRALRSHSQRGDQPSSGR